MPTVPDRVSVSEPASAFTFPAPAFTDYPYLRVSGDGTLTPERLLREKAFVYVSAFLTPLHFPENPKFCPFDDELVFFPVRRVSRIPIILAKIGLRAPTYHHAIAFGLRIKESPVAGTVLFSHAPVVIPPLGPCVFAYTPLGDRRFAVIPFRPMALRSPVWAVGLR